MLGFQRGVSQLQHQGQSDSQQETAEHSARCKDHAIWERGLARQVRRIQYMEIGALLLAVQIARHLGVVALFQQRVVRIERRLVASR
jgi:hypothetical protein